MAPSISIRKELPTPVSTQGLKDTGDTPTIAVIGVGYVGKHLVEVFSSSFKIIGYDVSSLRVKQLRLENRQPGQVAYSNNAEDLRAASHFLISVPTVLNSDGEIDLTHITSAMALVERYSRRGSIVVIESTVAVGTTRKLLENLAKYRGLFAGMSPERIDPGRISPPARSIPKVVSGLDDIVPGSLNAITRLYEKVFDTVVPVSKPEVAEMAKLYENCQRTIAIAYANEMADACAPFGIDPFEVAETSASKPFGYLPIFPSLGIGGHCIPLNPVYFMSTCNLPLLQQAHEKMATRPSQIADQLLAYLLKERNELEGPTHRRPRLLVVGLGFKSGQSNLTHSPGIQLLNRMHQSGKVDLMYCDPLVEQVAVPEVSRLEERHWTQEILETFDAIVVAVKQPGLDYGILETLDGVKIDVWQR
ncbi:nucleotide sugar dehydrogenase [Corynespora cassiicola Philippines]|uniref:Nucleotide sugar dehydrogenase n=1 Tax=Corynespora cassiicola Philippines TaxID=1448308 RepID=A0A2T2N8R9_CORCC|nr:nucleotide sugar dehydrogenase [Corynespora cassiicola Philippines]